MLGVPSYRESHVSGKGVPKSREMNIGMPQRRRQRVPQKWASKERRDCTRAVTDVGQGKREKRLTPCFRSCACIWLTKNRTLICQESTCERVRASVSENKQFIVHSLRKAANLKLLVEGKRWRPRWSSEYCSDTTLGEANKLVLRWGGKRRVDEFRMVLGGQPTPFCFYPVSRVTRNYETRRHNSFKYSAPNKSNLFFLLSHRMCLARSRYRRRPAG